MVHLRDNIWQDYRDVELQIVAVSVAESPAVVADWLEDNPMPFTILMDEFYEVTPLFTGGGVPFNTVLDGDPTLRFRGTGYSPDALTYWIDAILEESPAMASSWSELRSIY